MWVFIGGLQGARFCYWGGGYSPSNPHLESPMSENHLKLAGTSFETKDDYDFNVDNANEAMLLILQLTSAFCAHVGGPKAAPFEPLDFLQAGGPFREIGGRGLPWRYGNSSTALSACLPIPSLLVRYAYLTVMISLARERGLLWLRHEPLQSLALRFGTNSFLLRDPLY